MVHEERSEQLHRAKAALSKTVGFSQLNAALPFIWFIYLLMNIHLAALTPVHGFVTEGYITGMDLLETWRFANRPITVPLIYKLSFNNIDLIELVQYVIAILCWTILAYAFADLLKVRWLKVFGFALVLMFSVSREVFIWNSMILAESLSHSLMAAVLGGGIWLTTWYAQQAEGISTRQQLKMGAWSIGLLFLWSMTRDPNSYVLPFLGGLLLMALAYLRRQLQGRLLLPMMIALASLVIFALQLDSASRGGRWEIPFMNILGDRILTDEESTQFFVERGMVDTPPVMQYTGHRAWDFHPDHDLRMEIGEWMEQQGRQTYTAYLLSRPAKSLAAPLTHWEELLAYEYSLGFLVNITSDQQVPLWNRVISCLVFPDDVLTCHVKTNHTRTFKPYTAAFPLLMLGAPLLMVMVSGIDARQILPLAMFVTAYILGFIIWHGDADSVARHAVQVNILFRLACWFVMTLAVDRLIEALRNMK